MQEQGQLTAAAVQPPATSDPKAIARGERKNEVAAKPSPSAGAGKGEVQGGGEPEPGGVAARRNSGSSYSSSCSSSSCSVSVSSESSFSIVSARSTAPRGSCNRGQSPAAPSEQLREGPAFMDGDGDQAATVHREEGTGFEESTRGGGGEGGALEGRRKLKGGAAEEILDKSTGHPSAQSGVSSVGDEEGSLEDGDAAPGKDVPSDPKEREAVAAAGSPPTGGAAPRVGSRRDNFEDRLRRKLMTSHQREEDWHHDALRRADGVVPGAFWVPERANDGDDEGASASGRDEDESAEPSPREEPSAGKEKSPAPGRTFEERLRVKASLGGSSAATGPSRDDEEEALEGEEAAEGTVDRRRSMLRGESVPGAFWVSAGEVRGVPRKTFSGRIQEYYELESGRDWYIGGQEDVGASAAGGEEATQPPSRLFLDEEDAAAAAPRARGRVSWKHDGATGDAGGWPPTRRASSAPRVPDDGGGEAPAPSSLARGSLVTPSTKPSVRRLASQSSMSTIGAVQVDERAPQLNRLLFRRAGRFRRGRRKGSGHPHPPFIPGTVIIGGGAGTPGGGDVGEEDKEEEEEEEPPAVELEEVMKRPSRLSAMSKELRDYLVAISAQLVVEDEERGESFLVEAEPMGRGHHVGAKHGVLAAGSLCSLAALVVALSVLLAREYGANAASSTTGAVMPEACAQLTLGSSPPPTSLFDRRRTIEIVQERGSLRCGVASSESTGGFRIELCRSIAAVLLGNPDDFTAVAVTGSTRFQQLHGMDIDVLLFGDTHTVEREVRERTTGAGLTFTSPYYYDGLAYFGEPAYVECAEDEVRYGHCSSLRICTLEGTTGFDYVKSVFPSHFMLSAPSEEELMTMLQDDTCSVIARDRSRLLDLAAFAESKQYVVGRKTKTKEPLAIVTRNTDREFSDVVNLALQALFFGEEQGFVRDSSLCETYSTLTGRVSDLNLLNAVYCVGNYRDLLSHDIAESERGMNQINDGSTGMIYAIPFGAALPLCDGDNFALTAGEAVFGEIRKRGLLNCGVMSPESTTGENGGATAESNSVLAGMSVDYCHALAAASLNGDSEAVDIRFFQSKGIAYGALNDGTVDVLAGARIERKYDFASSESGFERGGAQFSTPFYLERDSASGSVNFYALATREDDALFSSFVNSIILASIYAQEGITSRKGYDIPVASHLFGSYYDWALKDAVSYIGSYGSIYSKNSSGKAVVLERGQNALNDGGPQIHSVSGLMDGR